MKGLSQAAGTDRHVPVSGFDVHTIRRDFPALQQLVHGKPLVYLDNAATTQKPQSVIDALVRFYTADCANIHRGVHELSERATRAYEGTRSRIRKFLGAAEDREIIFVRGATEGINLVAQSFGRSKVRLGDEVVISALEHHSNIVPWQQLAQRTGCRVKFLPITDDGQLVPDALDDLLTERTRLVSVVAVSNVLGTVNAVSKVIQRAHEAGALVLVDAAQSAPHGTTDVRAWDADFVAFSGHKMLGPSGIGVLYGREAILESMPPFLGGGSMIHRVTLDGFTPNEIPSRFEAGTPPIVPAIGLAAAIEYLQTTGLENIHRYERVLTKQAFEMLVRLDGVRILGPAPSLRGGMVSFVVEGVQANDLAMTLDEQGVAVRAGHHCAMPLHARLGVSASTRASFYFYNTPEEVEKLGEALQKALRVLRRKA